MKSEENGNGIFGIGEAAGDWAMSVESNVDDVMADPSRSMSRATVSSPIDRRRFLWGVLAFTLVGAIFLSKSAYLQVVNGNHYRALAEANRIRVHAIPAHRGILVDRNNIPLAENLPSFRLVGYTSILPPQTKAWSWPFIVTRQDIFSQAAAAFNLTLAELEKNANEAGDVEEILLAKDLSYEKVLSFMSSGRSIPGLSVELAPKRGYPTDAIPSLSHVIGYTSGVNEAEYAALRDEGYRSFDTIGKQGVESSHEAELRGTYGEDVFEVNAQGAPLRILSHTDPVDGQNLKLTIDARLQAYSELVLANHLKNRSVKRAAVVAMNPQNGEVLALVSYPAYDANKFSKGISQEDYDRLVNDPNAPLFPRATAGTYPSGSTIKPFFATAALAEGIVTPQTTFLSTGGLQLGDRFFPDWRPGGHGLTNVYHAIADSVNTYFYMIGGGNESFKGLGIEKLMDWARKFGLGIKTGIDLPGEAAGFLPSKAWKQEVKGEPWYIGDTYNASIGQGDILVTPLQMVRGTAAVANNGLMYTPHLVIGGGSSAVSVADPKTVSIIRDAMRTTVTNGTASSLQQLPVTAAGKTGTAQWNAKKVPHSWFTGFAPFDHPTIAIAVIVEEGGDATLATPVARDILQWYLTPR
ncbi:MAG: penicillin-binding protein 2 [Patescibacteria group bacterium]|jgi:penicillin-binding protein 2